MRATAESVDGKLAALACAVLFAAASAATHAQVPVQGTQPPPAQPPVTATPPAQPLPSRPGEYPKVSLTAGRSTVLTTEFNISRIAITNPAIADATVVQPREILIDGKAPGTISLIVWGTNGRSQYDLVVEQPVTNLQQNLQMLFPGEDIQVSTSDDSTILSGQVSSTNIMLRAGEIAQASAAKRTVINLLQVPGGSESQQVLLQVRFAEVNRRVLQELGVSLFLNKTNYAGRVTTQQFSAPIINDTAPGGAVFSDLLNLFFFDRKAGVGGVIRALESRGAFQSLAEPNLIAYNGQEASFLAGGEFPVPVVQGATGTVTVQFKEFGIRLTFKPTIAGDVIRLKVAPEVSALDFANGVSLGGFRIPALTTRRASTDVELRDGQSFAIAGLLDNISQDDTAAIPILSKLPIIGSLFKSKAERAEQTELMVLITPRLVRALDPDEVPPLPTRFKPIVPGGKGGVGGELEGAGMVDAPEASAATAPKAAIEKAGKKPKQ
jgi:pilus assembly protein CpaC